MLPLERLTIFLRTLVLQATWSFGGMQNLGFLHAILPALRRVHRGEALLEAARRHAAYFNTHPYMVGYILGVSIRLEEDLAAGRETNPKVVGLIKNRMAGPLAALGDALFWETLRPLFSLVVVSAVVLHPHDVDAALLGVGAFLVAFGLPALAFRWTGLVRGYRHALRVIDVLKTLDLQGVIRRARCLGLFTVGMLSVAFVVGAELPAPLDQNVAQGPYLDAARAVAIVAAMAALRVKISPSRLVYGVLAIGLAVGAATAL